MLTGFLIALVINKIIITSATVSLRNIPGKMLHTKENIFSLTHAKTCLHFGSCALLGYYAASSWSHLQESRFRPLMMGLMQCPETSVKNHPEQSSSP
jgi:hypothetical protein